MALLAVSRPVGAQPDRAQQMAEEARQHFVAGEYVEALELYEQVSELDPHPVILYNTARCYEELGDLPRALERFRAALEMAPPTAVAEELQAKIAEIEALLVEQGYELDTLDPETYVAVATVTVTSLPDGATVTINGEPVGTTPIDHLFLAPGTYEVAISLEGYQTHIRTLNIEEARNMAVHAGLRRLEATTDYRPPEPGFLELTGPRRGMAVYLDNEIVGRTPLSGTAVPPGRYSLLVEHEDFEPWTQDVLIASGETVRLYADATRREGLEDEGWDHRDWGVATLVGGGAFLATGLVFGVLAKADADRYARNVNVPNRDEIRESAKRDALIADIAFLAGGALVITATVLLLVEPGDEADVEREDELVHFEVGPIPDGWAVGFGGRF